MRQYIIRRILISLVILLGVSFVLYSFIRLMPGDFVSSMLAENKRSTPEQIAHLRHVYGLDKNLIQGYIEWLWSAVHGDFGTSFMYQKPVTAVIGEKMWISFYLAFPAFILGLLIAIPLGIISATKQYSKIDYGITTFALVGISLPTFFFSAVLMRTFAVSLRWFPLQGMRTARYQLTGWPLFLDMGWHFILPIIVFTITGIGGIMRFSRTNMLEVMNSDYVRTARAKGLSETAVIYNHAFRNTLIPIVTMIGGALPGLFSGAIITEGIFAIDGIGRTALLALTSSDIPFLMGFNMFLAALTLLGNLISDILYAVVDPRVRYS